MSATEDENGERHRMAYRIRPTPGLPGWYDVLRGYDCAICQQIRGRKEANAACAKWNTMRVDRARAQAYAK